VWRRYRLHSLGPQARHPTACRYGRLVGREHCPGRHTVLVATCLRVAPGWCMSGRSGCRACPQLSHNSNTSSCQIIKQCSQPARPPPRPRPEIYVNTEDWRHKGGQLSPDSQSDHARPEYKPRGQGGNKPLGRHGDKLYDALDLALDPICDTTWLRGVVQPGY